jgi:hypothetical protein
MKSPGPSGVTDAGGIAHRLGDGGVGLSVPVPINQSLPLTTPVLSLVRFGVSNKRTDQLVDLAPAPQGRPTGPADAAGILNRLRQEEATVRL